MYLCMFFLNVIVWQWSSEQLKLDFHLGIRCFLVTQTLTCKSQTLLCPHPPACIYYKETQGICQKTNWSQILEVFWSECSATAKAPSQVITNEESRKQNSAKVKQKFIFNLCSDFLNNFGKFGSLPILVFGQKDLNSC